MTRRRKAPKRRPRSRHAGLEIRWDATRGAWRWRGRVTVNGRTRVGRWREDQDQAAGDRETLREHGGAFRRARGITLGEALDQVLAAARRRGVLERTLRDDYGCRRRYLEAQLGEAVPLAELADADQVLDYVRAARGRGRAAGTIRRDLWLLGRAFDSAGLPNVLGEVRDAVRNTLKAAPARTEFLTPAKLREILAAVRAGSEADADLLEIVAVTGVRAGELGRIRVRDVDIDPPRLHVREPKDRGNPRIAEVPAGSVPALERLVAAARERPGEGRALERPLVPHSEATLKRVCTRWRRRLDLPALSGRMLRHSFNTAAVLVGGSTLTEVMELAGHRRAATTSRYLHAIGDRRREIVGRVGEALTGGKGE